MTKRWSPPGAGWIRTADYGHTAIWMRPTPTGVEVAAYLGSRYDGAAEHWIVAYPRGTRMPYIVMDKTHRIRWAQDNPTDRDHMVLHWRHRTTTATHQGHRRLNHNRSVWRWPLPRRVRAAIDDCGGRVQP